MRIFKPRIAPFRFLFGNFYLYSVLRFQLDKTRPFDQWQRALYPNFISIGNHMISHIKLMGYK